jgi:basic membrane lipoprotein Med (substrate-binding protein (PBP1-ABC) superfamily)
MIVVMPNVARAVFFALAPFLVLITACAAPSEERGPAELTVAVVASEMAPSHLRRAARGGLQRIAADLDAQTVWVETRSSAEGRESLAEQARRGTDLIFLVDRSFEQWAMTEAAGYPDSLFVILPGASREANVGSIRFVAEEAGFVAGATAAVLTESRRTAIIRGSGRLWLNAIEDGWVAGFSSRRRRAQVEVISSADEVTALAADGLEIALYATDAVEDEVLQAAAASGVQLVVTQTAFMSKAGRAAVAAVHIDVPEAMIRVAREVRDGAPADRVFTFDFGSGVLAIELSDSLEATELERARVAMDEAQAEVTAGLVEFDEFGL